MECRHSRRSSYLVAPACEFRGHPYQPLGFARGSCDKAAICELQTVGHVSFGCSNRSRKLTCRESSLASVCCCMRVAPMFYFRLQNTTSVPVKERLGGSRPSSSAVTMDPSFLVFFLHRVKDTFKLVEKLPTHCVSV